MKKVLERMAQIEAIKDMERSKDYIDPQIIEMLFAEQE